VQVQRTKEGGRRGGQQKQRTSRDARRRRRHDDTFFPRKRFFASRTNQKRELIKTALLLPVVGRCRPALQLLVIRLKPKSYPQTSSLHKMVASPVSLASHSSPAGASSIGASRSSAPSSSSSGTTTMRGRARVSSYDATLTANQAIRKRELHTFSVHFSVPNCKWVATIARAELPSSTADAAEKRRVQSFHFQTEREARKFAKVYSPPKMIADEPNCMVCQRQFTAKCRASNCRNCGVSICDDCSTRWASRMVPKTYSQQNLQIAPLTVRVCKSCDWLSNAFCMALLQGKHENVVSLVNTGNVNLRSSFADIHREAM
jgi:hypothetical protein